MLTTQNWLDVGYRRYDGQNLNHADFLLQKRFDDEDERLEHLGSAAEAIQGWLKGESYGC